MKILLVGEYNRSHKYLKEGLQNLGHEAMVVGLCDGFKKVNVDIEINQKFRIGPLKKLRSLIMRFFSIDLYFIHLRKQLLKQKSELENYDIVQFINESAFLCSAKDEQILFDLLTSWNKKAYLLSCGTDYSSVKFSLDKKFRYSIHTPYFEGRIKPTDFSLGLKYVTPEFVKLHHHIYNTIEGVISSDLDYYIPLENHKKHLGMIPHVINVDSIPYQEPNLEGKLTIFHGINRASYYKKGHDIFNAALDIIDTKYKTKVNIIKVENLPYKEYITAFDTAHILLDQIYAYDQGYNALEAMAKGKVVFTGAEKEWEDYYNVTPNTIVINALPDAQAIASKLEWLIENPEKIIDISKNARQFVKKYHDHTENAKLFLEKWA
ncbi:glycosyltransferase [Winogradskyella psychrotolerans]|uniref:glycosyltransferase n=1 Tax=Winogradskyella psychrotolerans TaxID=1344585 RepID=UPI001C064BB2|nr:glycosyltransferase [Winogradskyella psychrotolerans]MBU2927351.1 glycosyltransferase [Winogradskyella psychrotolerans]